MKYFRFWKSACWFILILFVTFLPGSSANRIKLFIHADKLIHLFLFGIFSLLLIFDGKRFFQTSSIEKNLVILVITAGVIAGLFTEFVQYFLIPGRSGTVGDFIADACGMAVGFGVYKIIGNKSK
jgi:VanZ family protein